MEGSTKPCSKCGQSNPSQLSRATAKRWWCTDCIRAANRDYYERNRERINNRRRKHRLRERKFAAVSDPHAYARVFTLIHDPSGHYRPNLTVFTKSELDGLCEDRFAPTGSVWIDNNGDRYEIEGEMLREDQRYVLLED